MVPHKVDNAFMGLAAAALGNGVRDGRQPVVALLPCSGVGFDLGIEGLWKRTN